MVFGIGKELQEVLPENLENLLSEGYKLIDVREQDEWDAGHHEEAKHVPMGTIPEKINDFNSDEKYIIINTMTNNPYIFKFKWKRLFRSSNYIIC